MTRKYLLILACGVAARICAADEVQPLDVRTGLWEIRLTVKAGGLPPLSPEMESKLSPEERARIDENAKRRAARGPQTTVKNSCLRAQDLDQPLGLTFGGRQGCRQTVVESTRRRQQIKVDCGNGETQGGGTVQIEASDPEHMRVTSQWIATYGVRMTTMTSTAVLTWLRAECETPAIPAAPAPPAAGDATSYYKRGKEQSAREEFAEAVKSLSLAIQQEPQNAQAYNARGYAFLRLRKLDLAIRDFTEAIRLRPGYANAYQNRAMARRRAGDASGAAEDQAKAAAR